MNDLNLQITEQLDFIRNILEKHDFPERVKSKINDSLAFIENKLKDSLLYMGVVGEFSSGKSTLINAFLEEELLVTDIIQGTTAAPTLIRFSDQKSISTYFSNGSYVPSKLDSDNQLSKILGEITAKEELSKYISLASIGYPADFLEQNIAIMDTPGVNSTNKRHTKVSQWILKNICDLPVVIIPADQPLSETLTNFLTNNMQGILKRCIFIVTKIDLITQQHRINKEKELERFKKTIERRIEQKIGIKNPNVQYLSLQKFFEKNKKQYNCTPQDLETNGDRFPEWKSNIIEVIGSNRYEIILEQSYNLLHRLSIELSDELDKKRKQYEKQHQALVDNKIPDLSNFINNKTKRYQKLLKDQIYPQIVESKRIITSEVDRIKSSIKFVIYSFNNRKELKKYVNDKLPDRLNSKLTSLEKVFIKEHEKIEKEANLVLKKFEDDFKITYQNLATLGGIVSSSKNLNYNRSLRRNLVEMSESAKEISIEGKIYSKSGATVTGGIIGTIIAPGVGTWIGATLGQGFNKLVTSLFFSLDKLKDDTWAQVSEALEPQMDKIQEGLNKQITELEKLLSKSLEQQIQEYYNEYEQIVSEKIREDEAKKARLKEYESIAEKDIQVIQSKASIIDEFLNETDNRYDRIFKTQIDQNKEEGKSLESMFKYMRFNNFTESLSGKYQKYFDKIREAENLVINKKFRKANRILTEIDTIELQDLRLIELSEKAKSGFRKRRFHIILSSVITISIIAVLIIIFFN